MTGRSGISGKSVARAGGSRFKVQWPARFFLDDKVIHQATVTAVFTSGFCLRFGQAIGIGKQMHLECLARLPDAEHRVRIKGKVDYCLLREGAAEIDVLITAIGREQKQTLTAILRGLEGTR